MINQETLYSSLDLARVKGSPVPMGVEEIQTRSARLNEDIEHLENVDGSSDDKKISQRELISECIMGIDLLGMYSKRVPLTGQEPIKFFRREYLTRLQILFGVLNTLISKVRISYNPRSSATGKRKKRTSR